MFKRRNPTSIYTDPDTASKIERKLWIHIVMEPMNKIYEEAINNTVSGRRRSTEVTGRRTSRKDELIFFEAGY